MKRVKVLLAVLAALVLVLVPAWAQEVGNPSTGDNSMVILAVVVMGVAALAIVAVLLLGKKGKKKRRK